MMGTTSPAVIHLGASIGSTLHRESFWDLLKKATVFSPPEPINAMQTQYK